MIPPNPPPRPPSPAPSPGVGGGADAVDTASEVRRVVGRLEVVAAVGAAPLGGGVRGASSATTPTGLNTTAFGHGHNSLADPHRLLHPIATDVSYGSGGGSCGDDGGGSVASSGYLSCVSFGASSSVDSTVVSPPSAASSNSSLLDAVTSTWSLEREDGEPLPPEPTRPAAPAANDGGVCGDPSENRQSASVTPGESGGGRLADTAVATATACAAAAAEPPPPPIVSDVEFGLREPPTRMESGAPLVGAPASPSIAPPLPALLVFNPSSGLAGGVGLEETLKALTNAGLIGIVTVQTTPDGDTAAATVAALRTSGPFGVVIAAGGDGTVSAVAAGLLAYTGEWKGAAAEGTVQKEVTTATDRGGSPSSPRPPRIPLAVLPRGTANALAAALSLPKNLESAAAAAAAAAALTSTGMVDVAAAQAAATADMQANGGSSGGSNRRHAPAPIAPGRVRALDVGTANGRPFLLLTGIGLEADVVVGARRSLKARLGTLAYVASSLSRGLSHTPWTLTYAVTAADGASASGTVPAATAVTVANTAPWTSVMAAAEAIPATTGSGDGESDANVPAVSDVSSVPDDGALDATAFTASAGGAPGTAAAVVGLGLAASAGAPPPKHVHTARIVRLTVDASPPQRVVIDGEPVGTTPVEFGVLPSALLVVGVGEAALHKGGGALAATAAGAVAAAVGITVGGVSKTVGGIVDGVAAVTRGVGGGLIAVGEKLQGAGGAGTGSPTAIAAATAETVWMPEEVEQAE